MNVTTNDQEKCDQALSVLYYVEDPEIGLNIVDLGLIYKLHFDDLDKILDCTMTLTTQFCPMGESITSNTQQYLNNSFPGWTVKINLVFEPAWSFEMVSPEGKAFLGQ